MPRSAGGEAAIAGWRDLARFHILGNLTGADVCVFSARKPRMFFRRPITGPPPREPHQPQSAGENKYRAPAVMDIDPWDRQRRRDDPQIGSGVEDAGSRGAFFLREPFGGGLDGGGKISAFTEAQK